MAPIALSTSSSGGSSPTSLSFSTPIDETQPEEATNSNSANGIPPVPKQQAPIAIVGMSCRLPGGVSSPQEFWELCSRARSGFMEGAPKERFSHEAFYHPDAGHTGTYHAKGGYFLTEDPALFDAPFFSLTEKEAIAMDPQQRMLLECTFEALDSASLPKHTLSGQNVGVFIGGSLSEYETHLSRDVEAMPMYQSTGCAQAMQSNRLSHFFDFRGPSFTLDTACSSSLVAVHAACQSLREGEAEMAVAGACHLNMMPDSFISFSTGRLLSDSGRSIAFDERGTGFGRGEGCGILILKPLDRALADGDAIRAVIRGTGINQDGKTAGITTPNGDAQEALIKRVYAAAGADPNDCGFVEAHGTGTKIGDPTEAGAIHAALSSTRTARDPLFIGSVKSNIGHLEAASGVAAVIKAALMLERGFILPNHDFKLPNSKIPWKEWGLTVPRAQRPWPRGKKYVSVNNFGFGGTNAHVVLERAPFEGGKRATSVSRRAASSDNSKHTDAAGRKRLFVLSANDKKSLEAVMANLVVYLEQRPEIFQSDLLEHLAHTLSRRSLLKWRLALPAPTAIALIESLNNPRTLPTKPSPQVPSSPAFVFTGQGAQWHAMGRELYTAFPIYTASLNRAQRCLHSLGATWSLLDELIQKDAESSNVSAAHVSQPACTAVQLALVDLLASWDIRPVAVTGHSSGEIAAAYAAGIITFDAAMAIAYHRGRMIPLLKEYFAPGLKGGMMAVGASRAAFLPVIDAVNATPTLAEKGERVRIACYNSPSSLTISGDLTALDELERVIRETQPDTFHRRLQVDVAYHSHHMDIVAAEYRKALRDLPLPVATSLGTRFHSSLHGGLIKGSECDADYWVNNLTRPVRFSEALESLLVVHDSQPLLIELGPHAALQGPIKQILQAIKTAAPYTSALIRKHNAVDTLLDLTSTIIAQGGLVNLDAVNAAPKGTSLLTDLPRYAWNHSTRYWHDSRLSRQHTHRGGRRGELIGLEALYSTEAERIWRRVFVLDEVPWVRHHLVQGLVVFPLGGFIHMAIEAVLLRENRRKDGGVELRDVDVVKPLAFPPAVVEGSASVEMSIALRQRHDDISRDKWCEFRICSWSAGSEWTEHCVGLVRTITPDIINAVVDGQKPLMADAKTAISSRHGSVDIDTDGMTAMYDALSEDLGVGYGPSFRGIEACKVADIFAVGNISVSDASSTGFHATVLESMMDMYWPILRSSPSTTAVETVYLASSIRHMTVAVNAPSSDMAAGRPLTAYCKASFDHANPHPTTADIFAVNAQDQAVCIEGLTVSPIIDPTSSISSQGPPRQLCYKLEWEPVSSKEPGPLPKDITLLHGSANSSSHNLATALSAVLHSPTLIEDFFNNATTTLLEDRTAIVLTDFDAPFLASPTTAQLAALQALTQSAGQILWVTRGANSTQPHANLISGLSRTVRSETGMAFAHLDFEDDIVADVIVEVIQRVAGGGDMEFAYRDNQLSVPRVVEDARMEDVVKQELDPDTFVEQQLGLATANGRAMRMEFSATSKGDEPRFAFVEDTTHQEPLAPNEIEFTVKAIGVTCHDATFAAQIPPSSTQAGLQASGIVTRVGTAVPSNFRPGTRIACLTSAMSATGPGAYATLARTTTSMVVPDEVSFEDAASLPLPYTTAQYALIDQARLEADQRILVTCPLDPVGQAAISLASSKAAVVFAVAKSQEERAAIIDRSPSVHVVLLNPHRPLIGKETHVAIMKATYGEGFDVVFDLVDSSAPQNVRLRDLWTRCLAPFGCLLRVDEPAAPVAAKQQHRHAIHEVQPSSDLCDIATPRNVSCLTIDMLSLGHQRPRILQHVFNDVSQLFHESRLPPILNFETLPFSRAHEALAPKVATDPKQYVLVAKSDDLILAPPPPKDSTIIMNQEATYLIVGGTGGLGRSIARWLAHNGAGHILLLSRSGTITPEIEALKAESPNSHIHVRSCDVSIKSDVDALFAWHTSQSLPPIKGLIHSAMVLHDTLFETLSQPQYTAVLASKVQGAWNLHQVIPNLDFFITISSVSAIVGNRGQAAYAAANTFLDALVHHRQSAGLPATSLALAAVSDAGYLTQDEERKAEVLRNLGGEEANTICEREVLALVRAAVLGETGAHVITGVGLSGVSGTLPFWAEDAKFSRLDRSAVEDAGVEEGGEGRATDLTPSLTQAEAEDAVCRGLVAKIAEVLMMEPEELDVTRTLSHYPLDSLVAIEIRNFIARKYEASMQVLELLSSGSIQTLSSAVCRKSKIWQAGTSGGV